MQSSSGTMELRMASGLSNQIIHSVGYN